MNPIEILEKATAEGITFTLSANGSIQLKGDKSKIDNWLTAIRNNKPAVMSELQRKLRRNKVLAMLDSTPDAGYAVHVEDTSTDPIIVAVAIRGLAAFELEIPQKYYDGLVLLELIENYTESQNERI